MVLLNKGYFVGADYNYKNGPMMLSWRTVGRKGELTLFMCTCTFPLLFPLTPSTVSQIINAEAGKLCTAKGNIYLVTSHVLWPSLVILALSTVMNSMSCSFSMEFLLAFMRPRCAAPYFKTWSIKLLNHKSLKTEL